MKLHKYQEHAVQQIIDKPAVGLFLEMGLGKTLTTLTAVNRLLFDEMEVTKVLVIAPLRVAQSTWHAEINKWPHLRHLVLSKVLGDVNQRVAALRAKADIYIINKENVQWLVNHYQSGWPFDMVVIDELSSFKSNKAERFKKLRMVRPKIKRIVGLTGTPAPNGLTDLWAQMYLLDQGQRLGTTITGFREKYFILKRSGFGYNPRDEAQEQISKVIGDICISMKAKDYLELPERVDNIIPVTLSADVMKQYLEFEKEQVLSIMGEELTALSAGALYGKLLQFAGGAVYNADRKVIWLHDAKLEALKELIDEAQGKPVLIAYAFIHEKERIMARFKNAKELKGDAGVVAWNRGEIEIGIGHPASMGHGLNLQAGGHILIWYGQTNNLEHYLQFIARLDRQGQREVVVNNRLVAEGTLEMEVAELIDGKADVQERLMESVKARIEKYRN